MRANKRNAYYGAILFSRRFLSRLCERINLACVLGGCASKYMLINVEIAIAFEQFV